jgi:methylenetetrahydrofolate dehydrogenase (NADP+)/methenyltetrahydrofolate cyclohydrolase
MAETRRLAGKPVADALKKQILERTERLKEQGEFPKLLIIRVGAREDDISYEKSIINNCGKLGVIAEVKELPADASQESLTQTIEDANKNDEIHGIMLFRPLPKGIDAEAINHVIDPAKDVDCMSPDNLEQIFEGKSRGFTPCTAQAVVEMLKFYEIPLTGANVVVAGRSLVVGKPLSMLLLDENCTVTICHSRTKDMREITKKADIVVAAIGKAKLFDSSYFSEGQTVIDVGINEDPKTGKMCGDVDYEDVFGKVANLNPAIGGVGAVTTTLLIGQIVSACERAVGRE